MLPTFFIIGAARAATTTLWGTLNEHPDVFLPELKETHYLLGGEWARRGQGWYESLYQPAGVASQRGEASTSYSMFPIFRGVPERAHELAPHARIIYMIRHPVTRMVSQWAQATTSGHESRPLEQALVWNSPYYFSSCYGLQLTRWRHLFPADAVLVLRSEDLSANPGPAIDRILAHLDLAAGWRPRHAPPRANATDWKLRARPGLTALSGALRGAGLDGPAVRIARRSPLKERMRLVRRYRPSELALSEDLAHELSNCFRADFLQLRKLVGDRLDLYGIA